MVDSSYRTTVSNSLGFFNQKPVDEVLPATWGEVKGLLEEAHVTGRPLYPLSTGYNWGMGSKIPPADAVVLNLSKLNRILSYDPELGLIEVEPGVTQKDVYEFLKRNESRFFLDVTGSSEDTSLMGNALERGVSYKGQRVDRVVSLEVLLPDGRLLQTGHERFHKDGVKSPYGSGLGPDLKHLFFQSNFGVVKSMVYQLCRRKAYHYGLVLSFSDDNSLCRAMDEFNDLLHLGVIDSVFHIGNSARLREVLAPSVSKRAEQDHLVDLKKVESLIKGSWVGSGSVTGDTFAEVRYKVKAIKKRLGRYGQVRIARVGWEGWAARWLNVFGLRWLSGLLLATKSLKQLYIGVPTNDTLGIVMDYPIFRKTKTPAIHVDESHRGFQYCLPILSMTSSECRRLLNFLNQVQQDQDFPLAVTLNPVRENILEAVISIQYDKSQSEQAFRSRRKLNLELLNREFVVYRCDIKSMDVYNDGSVHSSICRSLKKQLDPRGVIAPGRYVL